MVTKDGEGYEKHKRRMAKRAADQSQEAREIGPLPAIKDSARRERCKHSLRLFLETYFRETFCLEWSDDHLRVIAKLEKAILEGGVFALAMPRGTGKTSLVIHAALWAISYGHRRFVVAIGATSPAAKGMLEVIKAIVEDAIEYGDDFPEVCHPIRALEGINQRAAGQTLNGEQTKIKWTADRLVFPTVAGAASSGARLRVAGITGAIRGMSARAPDGSIERPDLALIDDPQTDSSARSITETAKRQRSVNGAVLGLSGPGQKIACVMPCTVICEDDLADRLLDRQRSPDWQGEKMVLLKSMPTNMALWEQYRDIRADSLREFGDIRGATSFYGENREAMDEGAEASWPQRFELDQLSAIQYAMDLWAKDPFSFFAEYQNAPLKDEVGGSGAISPAAMAARFNGLKKWERPSWSEYITAGVDIQKDVLFYVVVAWTKTLRGQVLAYGALPDQFKPYYTLHDLRTTLEQKYKTATITEAIIEGLSELAKGLLDRDLGGKAVDLIGCDANWAESTDTVYELARVLGSRFLPYHGRFIGAASVPMEQWKKDHGDREGPGWRVAFGKRKQKHIVSDANYWKTKTAELCKTTSQESGIWIYGNDANEHRMFSDHLGGEFPVHVEGRGRKLDEWKQRPGRDNHWFDCLVSSAVAASVLGASAPGQTVKPPKQKVSYAEQQKQRRLGA